MPRWKLGRALAKVERASEDGRPKKTTNRVSGFWKWTKEKLGLEPPTVVEAQRIGAMPDLPLRRLRLGDAEVLEGLVGSVYRWPFVATVDLSSMFASPSRASPRSLASPAAARLL